MEFNSFLERFNDTLLEDDVTGISAETEFRKLGSWDSLSGMAIIVMIEDTYGVKIDDKTFKSFSTVSDIFKYVQSNV